MPNSPQETTRAIITNLPAKTGRSFDERVALTREKTGHQPTGDEQIGARSSPGSRANMAWDTAPRSSSPQRRSSPPTT